MSLPPLNPEKSVSGIAVDPRTNERVIPPSRRADGSVRKERKVRPGYTPQEDVSVFRTSRQQVQQRNQLPKGHIPGWGAPTAELAKKSMSGSGAGGAGGDGSGDGKMSKSAAKNAKRKAKKVAEKEKVVRESWEDDEEEVESANGKALPVGSEKITEGGKEDVSGNTLLAVTDSTVDVREAKEENTDLRQTGFKEGKADAVEDGLSDELRKLDIR